MFASRALLLLFYVFSFCSNPVTAVVPDRVAVRLTTSDLFQIGDSTTGGRCSTDQIDTIDDWLEECVDILNAALTAYHSYSTSKAYRTMFGLWLSMMWDDNEIADFYDSYWDLIGKGVATFLSGGGLTGGSNDKPYLFCGDSFAQKQSWEATAIDGTGTEMVKERDENGEPTSYYTIEEVYPNLRQLQLDGELDADTTNTNKNIAPFLVSKLKGYVFDASGKDRLCDKVNRVAATSRADNNAGTEAGSPAGFTYATFNRHVYFCDVAFEASPGNPHGYETLAEVVNSNNYPTVGADTNPAVLTSLSCTLYHELFHLTDAQGTDSDGPGSGYYLAKDIMKLSWNSRLRALLNAPEPYVFFSMGAYILQNNPSAAKPAVFFGPPGWIQA
ncbi:uncharacterized protein BDW70DRAFT_162329 [Aspergillus foveolatus]|uniref:uncharacterized protein n=1 Tax=Aspergillus foveolatus TaxID=210207 RepID=UPI003CCD5B4E